MKHLKLFESDNNKVKVSVVTFSDMEMVKACYVDGQLEFFGDHYHDKIEEKIGGFILGLKYIKKSYIYNLNVSVEDLECIDVAMNERIADLGDIPPKELKDVSFKINEELLGIKKVIRRIRYEHEIDAEELEYLIDKNKISDLKYSEKKSKGVFTKIFLFKIESHRSFIDHEEIRVEFSNWIHPIKTPGLTDYNIFYNNKVMNVSRKKTKSIYKKLEKIYKS